MATPNHLVIQDIAHLNECGAWLLGQNRDAEAHRCLKQGLFLLQRVNQTLAVARQVNQEENELPHFRLKMARSVPVARLGDDRFSIFADALVVGYCPTTSATAGSTTTTAAARIPLTRWDVSLCTAVFLFNLALLLHKRAMSGAVGSSSKAFVAASRLYQQVFPVASELSQVLQQEQGNHQGIDESTAPTSRQYDAKQDLAFLRIAVLNNLAHIAYMEFSDFEEASLYLRWMNTEIGLALENEGEGHEAAFGTSLQSSSNPSPAFQNLRMHDLYLNLTLNNKTPTGARSA